MKRALAAIEKAKQALKGLPADTRDGIAGKIARAEAALIEADSFFKVDSIFNIVEEETKDDDDDDEMNGGIYVKEQIQWFSSFFDKKEETDDLESEQHGNTETPDWLESEQHGNAETPESPRKKKRTAGRIAWLEDMKRKLREATDETDQTEIASTLIVAGN